MADGLFGGGGAYFGNPNLQRQGASARALARQRDVNTLPDPRTYAAVSGLFGTAPDEMGFSVLHPQYQDIMRVAEPAFEVGTALGVAPLVGLAGKALGTGAMAVGRAGERYAERVVPQIMERGGLGAEMLQGMSRGTVSPMSELTVTGRRPTQVDPSALVFREKVQDRKKDLKVDTDEFDPIVVINDSGTLSILDGHNRASVAKDRGDSLAAVKINQAEYDVLQAQGFEDGEIAWAALQRADQKTAAGNLVSQFPGADIARGGDKAWDALIDMEGKSLTYPQQAALDLAQQRAALPVEQGGLGLAAGNTAEQRAAAMGAEFGWGHGSNNPNITTFKPSRTGAQGPGIYATNYLPETNMYSSLKDTGGTSYPLAVFKDEALVSKLNNPYDELKVAADDELISELFKRNKSAIITNQEPTPDWLLKQGVNEYPERQHYVSVNPDNFRSRFAAFDPFRRSAAVAAAMGAAAPDLLANPMYTDPFGNTIADTTR